MTELREGGKREGKGGKGREGKEKVWEEREGEKDSTLLN